MKVLIKKGLDKSDTNRSNHAFKENNSTFFCLFNTEPHSVHSFLIKKEKKTMCAMWLCVKEQKSHVSMSLDFLRATLAALRQMLV